jgi:pimeloyl-ACP methyl ester carboxylesterase
MRHIVFIALSASFSLILAGAARSQDNKEDVSFKTIDGVLIKGVFYSGSKGANSPTVIMLHKWGGNSTQSGWTELAKRLQDKGYSVLTFDFRGHGQSTTVDPEKFWKYQPNINHIKTYKKDQTTIKYSDFRPGYLPYLLNDIMAARLDLDNRNDSGGCNVSNILVIGAEDGANLGLAWMTSEFFRESINKKNDTMPWFWNPKVTLDRPASEDLAGAIFLSAPRAPQKLGFPYSRFMSLTKEKMRTIPMWFTYGADDKVGKDDANYFTEIFKLNKGDLKIKNLTLPIPQTKLRGAQLLNQATLPTPTEDLIEKFLENMVKLRPNEAKKIRNANEFKPYYAPVSELGFSP